MNNYKGFYIVPMDEENKRYTICYAGGRATQEEFESIEDAKLYIDMTPWDLIASMCYGIAMYIKNNKNERK